MTKLTPTTPAATVPRRPGRYLVIHVNAFTAQIDGGYTVRDGLVDAGSRMNRTAVIAYLVSNPTVQVEFLKV